MKLFTRIVSVILTASIGFSALSGCVGKTEEGEESITRSEWITLLGEEFGLDDYLSEEPYFRDVTSENACFAVVQSSVDWGILDPEEQDFHPDEAALWDFAVDTSVKAAGVALTEGETALDYAEKTGFIPDQNYMTVRAKLTAEDAQKILDWAKKIYLSDDSPDYSNVQMNENVRDFSEDTAIEMIRADEYRVPTSAGLQKGSVFIAPATPENPDGTAKKVVEITDNGDGTSTVITQEPGLEEVYDVLEFKEKAVPKKEDFSLAEGVEWVEEPTGTASQSTPQVRSLMNSTGSAPDTQQLSDEGFHGTLKVNFTKGTIGLSSGWRDLDFGDYKENFGVSYPSEFSGSSIIPDRSLFGRDPYDNSKDVADYEAGKITMEELKERLNLTKDQHEEIPYLDGKYNGGYEITGTISIKNLYFTPELQTKKVWGIPTGIERFKMTLNYEIESSLELKGELNGELEVSPIKIPLPIPGIWLDAVLSLSVDLNGELSVGVTLKNNIKAEYEDGKTKRTQKQSSDFTSQASVVMDAGPSVGVVVKLLGISIIDVKLDCFFRLKADASQNLSTEYTDLGDAIEITRKTTFDYGVNAYVPILILSMGNPGTLADKIGISFSWELMGEDKALKIEIIPTKSIVIWEDTQRVEARKEGETFGTLTGSRLDIDRYSVGLSPNESQQISVTQIPEGYSASDIVWSSSDSGVATVSPNGTVTAVASGSATITASTSDGVYTVQCSVSIADTGVDFTPMKGAA